MIFRALKFIVWTAAVIALLMIVLFLTQMGDCPEKVIDPAVGNACTIQKRLLGWGSLAIAAIAWIAGTYHIFRHRDSN